MKLALVLLMVGWSMGDDRLPRSLGTAGFRDPPAFMEVYTDENATPGDPEAQTLYISTFRPGQPIFNDDIYYLRNPGKWFRTPAKLVSAAKRVRDNNKWPNNPDRLPSEVVGREGVVWTSGFLVPGKKKGRLNLYFNDDQGWDGGYNIASEDTDDWSYHRVLWKDCDNDGDLDALIARFKTGFFGKVTGDFSWLENPGLGLAGVDGWNQHFIAENGPDVHFVNIELPSANGTVDAIIAAEFWQEKIGLWYTEDNNWGNPNVAYNVKRVAIDAPGEVFDVQIDDYNNDGKVEMMASVYDGKEGFVYVYDIPENWMAGDWPRRTIASGFKANFIPGGKSMTPGSHKPFWPTQAAKDAGLKPYISLSGDDDGHLYILAPTSEDPDNWDYDTLTLVDTMKTTSGKMAIGDFDNDGYTDIIAAGYTANNLYIFTYAPEGQ